MNGYQLSWQVDLLHGWFVFVERNEPSTLYFLNGQFVEDRFVDLLGRQELTLAATVAGLPATPALLAFDSWLRVDDVA